MSNIPCKLDPHSVPLLLRHASLPCGLRKKGREITYISNGLSFSAMRASRADCSQLGEEEGERAITYISNGEPPLRTKNDLDGRIKRETNCIRMA